MPLFGTPRNPRLMSLSSLKESQAVLPETQPFYSATPLSLSKHKAFSVLNRMEDETVKDSIKEITKECLQVLQTPVRDHKRKSASPAVNSLLNQIKTPQSILKVRRLSKSLLPGSKEKGSERRSSATRSLRLRGSKSDTSQHTSKEAFTPPTPLTQTQSPEASPASKEKEHGSARPVGTPVGTRGTTASVPTPKQLRFVGVSPMPTPSPTSVTSPLKTTEELSVSEEVMESPAEEEVVPSPQLSPKPTTHVEEKQKESPAAVAVEVTEMETETQEQLPPFSDGADDRYDDQMKELVRPDLQSPWKQGTLASPVFDTSHSTEVAVDDEVSLHFTPSRGQVVDISPIQSVERISMVQTAEKITVTKTVETISSTSTNFSTRRKNSSSPVKADLSASRHDLRSQPRQSPAAEKVTFITPITVDTTEKTTPTKVRSPREESPPVTPPSSKRARLMEEARPKSSTTTKQSLSPKRKGRTEETGEIDLEESPKRKGRKNEEEEHEKSPRRRKTPERRSPARTVKASAPFDTDRKSPARPLKDKEETREGSSSPPRKSRRTPDRRSPGRVTRTTKADAESTDTSPKRKSPGRNTRSNTEKEKTVEPEEIREIPTRAKRSPGRKLKTLEESEDKKSQETITSTSQTKADLSSSVRSTKSKAAMRSEHEPTEAFSDAEEVLGSLVQPDESSETHTRRKSARLMTPERVVDSSRLEPASPGRRGRSVRTADSKKKTTQDAKEEQSFRSLRHAVEDEVSAVKEVTPSRDDEKKKSPGRRGKEAEEEGGREEAIKNQKTKDTTTKEAKPAPKSPGRRGKQTNDQSEAAVVESADEEESHNLRRSTRQSRTPERLKEAESLEVLTPTRRSRRQLKPPEPLNTPEIQPLVAVKPTSPSPKRSTGVAKSPRSASPDQKEDSPAKTDKQASPPSTPTRRSKRQAKSPEKLNTDQIEPVAPKGSPTRAKNQGKGKSSPAASNTETEMADSQEQDSRDEDPLPPRTRAKSKSPSRSTRSPSRQSSPGRSSRSTRQTKSPSRQAGGKDEGKEDRGASTKDVKERTKVEKREETKKQEEPREAEDMEDFDVMPPLRFDVDEENDVDDGKTREEEDEPADEAQTTKTAKAGQTTKIKSRKADSTTTKGGKKERKRAAQDEWSPSFIFSPPLRHNLRSHDSKTVPAASSEQGHSFVFSKPTKASPDKNDTDSSNATQNKGRRGKRNLYTEDVLLVAPSPTERESRRSRQMSSSQRATFSILKRYKPKPTKTRPILKTPSLDQESGH